LAKQALAKRPTRDGAICRRPVAHVGVLQGERLVCHVEPPDAVGPGRDDLVDPVEHFVA
jgi:hypothetical protein